VQTAMPSIMHHHPRGTGIADVRLILVKGMLTSLGKTLTRRQELHRGSTSGSLEWMAAADEFCLAE